MEAFKQSFSWWCFEKRGINDLALLKSAKQIGYKGVDLIPEELWPAAKDEGLKIVAVSGHGMSQGGLNHDGSAMRIESELRQSIEKAELWNIPILICFSGNRREQSDETGFRNCATILSRIAPFAQRAGVTLAIELLNSKIDHPGYQADRTEWGVRLCEQVSSPAVALLYDIYHMQIMEGDIIRTIGRDNSRIAHYHTAGNPGRGPMTADQEINYPAVYRAIAKTNFRGFVGHEFIPHNDPLNALREAFQLCEKSINSGRASEGIISESNS